MKRSSKTALAAALAALTMGAATPAFAEGGMINPNGGFWAWFASLFSDAGSHMDPDGLDRGGGIDPNG